MTSPRIVYAKAYVGAYAAGRASFTVKVKTGYFANYVHIGGDEKKPPDTWVPATESAVVMLRVLTPDGYDLTGVEYSDGAASGVYVRTVAA